MLGILPISAAPISATSASAVATFGEFLVVDDLPRAYFRRQAPPSIFGQFFDIGGPLSYNNTLASYIHVGSPWRGMYPVPPSGGLTQGDLQQAAHLAREPLAVTNDTGVELHPNYALPHRRPFAAWLPALQYYFVIGAENPPAPDTNDWYPIYPFRVWRKTPLVAHFQFLATPHETDFPRQAFVICVVDSTASITRFALSESDETRFITSTAGVTRLTLNTQC